MNYRSVARVSLALIFIAPLFVLFFLIGMPSLPPLSQWGEPTLWSLFQAATSALVSLVTGILLALGFCRTSARFQRWAWGAMILPVVLPVITICSGILIARDFYPHIFTPWISVVIAHVVLNAGFVALGLHGLLARQLGGQIESALALGAGRLQILNRIVWPQARKTVAVQFLIVFMISWTSYAVPIALGLGQVPSFETIIREQIQLAARLDFAFGLILIEVLLLAIVGQWLVLPFDGSVKGSRALHAIGVPHVIKVWGLILGFFITLLLTDAVAGIPLLLNVGDKPIWLWPALLNTIYLSVGTGLLTIIFLAFITYLMPHRNFRRWIMASVAPSTVLVGVALFLFAPESTAGLLILLMAGLVILNLSFLYRWVLDRGVVALEHQIRLAQSLGASDILIWRKVVWPQVAQPIQLAGVVASFWACGDFALTGLVVSDDLTLPLVIQSLLNRYQFELSSALMLLLVVVAVVSGLIVNGVMYVVGRKLN